MKPNLYYANLFHMTATIMQPQAAAKNDAHGSLQDRVSYNIRVLLAIRQTSQQDLAKAMGIAAASLSQKFSGRIRWNLDDIEKASGFLGVNPEALVAGHGFEPWTSGL
ncbi:helix-turn-helix domain-containing protein [Bifidobacterium breve]|uniref:helix-turn-helix domain-containing protein n=1 Tax=Bifidobacterium breve TaxID=1685 RepID=UPI001E600840|nr:helix-turn-helix transcriptional regulator [Bifidobacterium breve]